MKQIFKYKWCPGYKTMYDYAYKHNHMITKEAEERLKLLSFWKHYGLRAATEAFGVKRSTLYYWQKIYRDNNRQIESLTPKSTKPKRTRKRQINPLVIKEIKRLRYDVCPNLGKDKVKVFLDDFCLKQGLKILSSSTIGRTIEDYRIYHHRQKVSHYGVIKTVKKKKKLRKPKDFIAYEPGDLIEIDTIVKFLHGLKRYVITAVDAKTRYTFSWGYLRANSQNARDFFIKLKTAFPYPIRRVQTDNGSEFHKYFTEYLKQQQTIHYWNYPKQPYKNGHIEKYNRTIQEEFIDWNEILLEEPLRFNRKLMDYLIWYNTERPHWSLKLKSPVDYLIENNYLSKMCWTDTRRNLHYRFLLDLRFF